MTGDDLVLPSRRRQLWSLGVGLGLLLTVLLLIGWDLANRPVQGTEGLILQEQMLVALFQAIIGLAVALSTIYYAMRTFDMTQLMRAQILTGREDRVREAVDELIGALSDVIGHGAVLASAQRQTRSWWIPKRKAAGAMAVVAYQNGTTAVAAVGRAFELVRHRAPHLSNTAEGIFDVSVAILEAAGDGTPVDDMKPFARRGYELTQLIRRQLDGLESADD